MIQAYPEQLSVLAGANLTLHVGTDQTEFRVALFRQGATLDLIHDFGWQQTRNIGFVPGAADADWGWDGYEYPIGAEWPSGPYIAMLWERGPNGETAPDGGVGTTAGKFGKALFVVRSPSPQSTMLYRVPIATFHAYNETGGSSLYTPYNTGRVTMRRPGGGAGGTVRDFEQPGMGDMDALDAASSRQTFEHYDARFIRWLEASGFHPDYCADIDCHVQSGAELMASYGVVISVGHDEYWSPELYGNLSAYVAQGGNLAMFSGNSCWWRIHYDPDLSGFACKKSEDPNDATSDHWWIAALHNNNLPNENQLIGVSYRNAGGMWSPDRPQVGYDVQHADHWVFEGINDSSFGENESLVGYECDGAELTAASASDGAPALPTYQDGTPADFKVLAVGRLPNNWQDQPARDPNSPTAAVAPRAATMGIRTASGTIFTASTTDWARVLEGGIPAVDRITRNVLGRLGAIERGQAAIAQLNDVVALDGFYSDDDQFRHGIVAQSDGTVSELFFNPNAGGGQAALGQYDDIADIAAFYTGDDQYRHAIVAQNGGQITEIFFHPVQGSGETQIAQIDGVASIAGFYSSDDGYRHVIAATKSGSLFEVFYHPQFGQGQALIGEFDGITDVGSFFSPDDNFRHAVVLSGDDVTEVFFHPKQGSGRMVVASVPGAARVSGFFADGDSEFSRRIAVGGADGRLHEIRYSPKAGTVRSVIANTGKVQDLGGFASSDDNFRHVMFAEAASVSELFYRP